MLKTLHHFCIFMPKNYVIFTYFFLLIVEKGVAVDAKGSSVCTR